MTLDPQENHLRLSIYLNHFRGITFAPNWTTFVSNESCYSPNTSMNKDLVKNSIPYNITHHNIRETSIPYNQETHNT